MTLLDFTTVADLESFMESLSSSFEQWSRHPKWRQPSDTGVASTSMKRVRTVGGYISPSVGLTTRQRPSMSVGISMGMTWRHWPTNVSTPWHGKTRY